MSQVTAPVLDIEKLQQAANEAAMKGALKSIEEFYTGYNSPYRKFVDDELGKKELTFGLDLPDIIAKLNHCLSLEIDKITNTAIAKTFVPIVQKFLVREDKDVKFSDILRNFIEETEKTGHNDDYEVTVEKHDRYDWLEVNISNGKENYQLTLHEVYRNNDQKDQPVKYHIFSLPYDFDKHPQKMKVALVDGATLEMPFTTDVLRNPFISYIARLILGGCQITIDTKEFEEEMFPERCHC